MRPPTKGRVLKERVWCFVEALLAHAEDSPDFEVHWETDKDTGRPNFVVKTKRRFLESLAQLKQHELYEVIKSLEKLQIWDDRRLKRRKGSEIGWFALKLWSTDAQRNWEHFDRIWEDSRTEKSKALEATYNESKDSPEASQSEIDWHDICLAMLEKQKRLTTNELLSADEDMKFELDDIHVPLALVQRTKPDKRNGDVSPEEGSRLLQPTYEEKQRYGHEEFLAQVLQEGKGQSKGRRIAVIGEPGAGKTTLLQSIAFWLFEDKNQNLGLPIWIYLADLQGKTLEEYLLQRWLKNALEAVRVTPEQENALVELFKQERVWLFLDGVDEIAGSSLGANHELPLQRVASQLEGWVAKARVVLSCRLNVWEANINALGDGFETYRLLDFDYPLQVKEFICRWFRKTDADKGEGLWTELDKSERQRIQDLVKNPLRLALLCSTWQSSDKGLPSTKAGLYERFVEVFYTWKKNRFPTTFEQRQELNAALGRLALRAIDSEESRFRLRHKVVCEVLGDPEEEGSLFGLALQLGWLNKVGLAAESETEERVYAFFHPTFQEYFAACAILDWDFFLPRDHIDKPVTDKDNPDRYKRYRIFEPQWKEVILLWLGRKDVAKEKKEAFVEALLKFEDGCGKFYEFRANFIAAAGIEEFRECNRADEIVEQLVKWGFGLFKLKQQKWQKFFEPIDENARAALGESDRSRAINPLIHLLRTSQDTTSRNCLGQVVRTIGEIALGSQDAINVLIELLHNSQDKYLCQQAFTSLAKIALGNRYAIDTLAHLLNTSKDEETLSHAAFCLGKIHPGNLTAITTLIDLLCNPDERLFVATANTHPQTNQKDFALESEQIRKWSTAARHLEEIAFGNQDVIKALSDLLQTTKDQEICRRIGATLEKIDPGNQDAIKTLTNLLHNSLDETVRWRTILKLGEIKTGDSIKALTEVLFTSHKETEIWRAAESLGQIDPGNSDAINALIQLLKTSQDEYTLRVAPSVLGQISAGNQEALECLIELLHNSRHEFNRQQYATILMAIEPNNPNAINTLIELLNISHDQFILEHSALYLSVINPGNSDAIQALKNVLYKSKYEATRMNAAYILGRLDPGNAEASTHLMDIVCNSQDGWSNFAFYRLKEILPSRLFPVIVAQLKNGFEPLALINKNNLTCDFGYWSPDYAILWHCAQNVTYPAFYQAWHQQEEVEKTTTPNSQSLNQADLPQSLQIAIANDSQLSQIIHLICIDGNQFIEPDRPAAEIYDQMLDQNCPECNSVPETMLALKLYWNSFKRRSDKRVVLVFFYASSTDTTSAKDTAMPYPYSETFLSDLSRFGDRICVVTNQSLDHIPLKFFTPSQPIEDVMQWIRAITTEQ